MTDSTPATGAKGLSPDERERRRKKQYKRMSKVLASAWELDASTNAFQEDPKSTTSYVLSLTSIGQKLENSNTENSSNKDDEPHYRLGRHGWEAFAHDLGGVYNRHVKRRTKRADLAKEHFQVVKELLEARDKSLGDVATAAQPIDEANSNGNGAASKKRKAQDSRSNGSAAKKSKKSSKTNKNKELAQREDRAMGQLAQFVEEKGGSPSLIEGFRSRVTKKSGGKFDVNFYNEEGRRFRSMLEVGRFFKLISAAAGPAIRRRANNKSSSKAAEAEKKKLRKELERLQKAHQRAAKTLDDFVSDDKESRYPIDDSQLIEELREEYANSDDAKKSAIVSRTSCAGARIPDIDGFPGVPSHCVPDVLMAWDFLCTFQRALSLTPIALDDFASALTYTPPQGQLGDDVAAPPVYLAEAHLGLLKFLFQDASSDDWWYSTLETDELPPDAEEADTAIEGDQVGNPVIKFDMAALLGESEDPVRTASWIKALEPVRNGAVKGASANQTIKAATKVSENKWVQAYLRKVLEGSKSNGSRFLKLGVEFLVHRVEEARPELADASVKPEVSLAAREKVIRDANAAMGILDATAPVVTHDDVLSDVEYDSESDDDEDEADGKPAAVIPSEPKREESENRASTVPPRPDPNLVDLLLPPSRPEPNSDYLNPFTWTHMTGAAASRLLHRRKRLSNEIDDYLRDSHEMQPITIPQRREREKQAPSRMLTECADETDGTSPVERAIEHLCAGGNYLHLSAAERLCVLRLLIEAAYDTSRVFEVVNGNIKQRQSAMKALEVEQRRAKREAKEKASADEAAAREELALEAKVKFVDEKRDEIRKLNDKSKEFDSEMIESLTEEDILDFDEDFKADYEALPPPESFKKTDVLAMVKQMQEEAAFDTDSLHVLTLEELLDRERRYIEEIERDLAGLGGENALLDPYLDKETTRSIEQLRKDITKTKDLAERLPDLREKALEQLKDAMEDGTIKVLRSAVTAGKKAKLSGPDDETGGVWAVDLMRDAALELDKAKQNKRVLDAQRDLVAKRNKCFIRSEPMGRDRFGNRFWTLDGDEDGHVWVETELIVDDEGVASTKPPPGFLDLALSGDPQSIACCAKDMEEDYMGDPEKSDPVRFQEFSRKEYHSAGFIPSLVKNHWGCLATEESLRASIKVLDGRGKQENELKACLKESVEHVAGNDEKQEASKEESVLLAAVDDEAAETEAPEGEAPDLLSSDDEEKFRLAREAAITAAAQNGRSGSNVIASEILEKLSSGIGERVRVRDALVEGTKELPIAHYETGTVTGWKLSREEVHVEHTDDELDDDDESMMETILVPVWRVATDRGHTRWLNGRELMEALCRYRKWMDGRGYFEDDAAFFAYRNTLGKYLGRASDAPYSSSPNALASMMVKREGDLYSKLKIRSYDNNWGGKSGARALWTNSMKDYAFDFQTVRQGLLTLENAFFELTGEFSEYENVNTSAVVDAKALVTDPAARLDIELETMEKNIPGLWNSPTSRAVYIEIVSSCKTTGFLALALDLLCRNTTKYLRIHKLLATKTTDETSYVPSFYEETSSRGSRRLNVWQRKERVNYEDFF